MVRSILGNMGSSKCYLIMGAVYAVLFVILASPQAFKVTGKIITTPHFQEDGKPKFLGLIVHALVFTAVAMVLAKVLCKVI